ncbi:MAG: peptidoglycan DD-metalloendopeptidase family protein [Dehalococcoidia bacterium]|nr:peptidoglycan DD-metalloendopeptidase family protein [Dehalococcoidia bacterium]
MGKLRLWLSVISLVAVLALNACSWPRVSAARSKAQAPAPTPGVEASPEPSPPAVTVVPTIPPASEVTPTRVATSVATPVAPAIPARTPTPTATASPQVVASRLGFVMPVRGAHVPEWLDLVPGAPRVYRSGVHEGVDFGYNSVGVTVLVGTPVLAAGDGVVVRADLNYREPSKEEIDQLLARCASQGNTSEADLDTLRGKQVWIDHGQGVVTRYAHLDRIAPGVKAGMSVTRGQLIAYVGLSGIPDGGVGDGPHLHFEIRVGDTYLGQGLSQVQARNLYVQALSGKTAGGL